LNIYRQKKQWKTLLFVVAVLIVGVSLWYTNILVHKIAQDERNKIHTWADAIHQRVNLVNSTDRFFQQLREEERKRVELLVDATKRMVYADNNEDLTFYSEIISNNKTIPVIITDAGRMYYYYYKDSRLFTELKVMLDDLISSFFSEVVNNSASVPVIITDSTRSKLISYGGHLDTLRLHDTKYLRQIIAEMASENDPIIINVADQGKRYIFYKDSFLLTQLRYFPIIQFAIIGIFLLVAYLLFSTSRRAEQNQVWVGLAKETAHQLGTPLSSMMAWVDYLETKGIDSDTISELQKDVGRLETITERFSKIGSAAALKDENIVELIYKAISYLKTRTSPKVEFEITPSINTHIIVPLNYQLFDWVIENLVKNAADAMSGKGKLTVIITSEEKYVYIDVADTGKGLPKNMFKTIFNPGYTSKQRGWGLGLSLSQRIIRDYHSGKIFVKSSIVGKGTTFRIILKK